MPQPGPATIFAGMTHADSDVDLAAIERDLSDVEAALERLNDGTHWTDEVTGEPLPAELLAARPTARTATTDTVA